jgi:[NiFe] hydrogenase assembly HybE family chaperone
MSLEEIGRPGNPAEAVESAFIAIAGGAMRDMPLNNPTLRVEAVGFSLWQDHWVGVLITPWAMNLMLLPCGNPELRVLGGSAVQHWRFPCGAYEFHGGWLEGLGPYQSCSLFSPPAEFPDQDSARAVALEIMAALFRPEAELRPAPATLSRRAFLRGNFGKAG